MESLVGARYFFTMDLKSGFWQVKMSKESQQYTAFTVGSMGMYEFLRMPYGLCNAPVMFQCLVTNSYFILWEFNTSQKELFLVSSRSISSLISGGDSGESWVLVHALGLLWLGRSARL